MQSTWQALIWKEWRDMRWKVAAIVTIALATQAIFVIMIDPYPGAAYELGSSFLGMAVAVTVCFLGMGIAAGEESAGTIGFLQMLPASPRRAAVVKLAMVLAALAVVIAALLGLVAMEEWLSPLRAHDGWRGDTHFGIENWYWSRVAYAVAGGASVLLWGLAAGVNRCDEIRAAALGFITIAFAWGAFGLLAYLFTENRGSVPDAMAVVLPALPGGTAMMRSDLLASPFTKVTACLLSFAVHAGLACRFIAAFGRVLPAKLQTVEHEEDFSAFPARRADWLAPPRRGPRAALFWKQTRESIALALLGGGLIAAICIAIIVGARLGWVDMTGERENILGLAGVVWAMLGYAIALVAGIAIFMDDLRPELQGFWRSRPIPVGQWFTIKLLAGAGVTFGFLLAGLAAAVLVAAALAQDSVLSSIGWEEIAWVGGMLAVHACVYLSAVALMAWLRHPVYAGVLASGSPWAIFWVAVVLLNALQSVFGDIPAPPSNEWRLLTITAILTVGAVGVASPLVTAAWLAVKHDWGWKH